MPCHAMLCYAMQCYAMQCYAMPFLQHIPQILQNHTSESTGFRDNLPTRYTTAKFHSKQSHTKKLWAQVPGESPTNSGISPLKNKKLIESNLLKGTFLAKKLAVYDSIARSQGAPVECGNFWKFMRDTFFQTRGTRTLKGTRALRAL